MRKLMLLLLVAFVLLLTTACRGDAVDPGEFNIETARIGVMLGTTGERFAMETYPDAQIYSFGNVMEAIAALQAGRVYAVITVDVICRNIERENPDLERIPELLTNEYIAAGVRRGDDKLLAELNRIIAMFWEDGTFDDMKERWIESHPPIPVTIPAVTEGEPLRVGTAAVSMPFIFRDAEQNTVGYAPELALRIGQELGRPIEFVTVEFAALIMALESGRVDVIIDMMAATEERRQAINFTEPYYISGQNILIRRADTTTQTAGLSWEGLTERVRRNLIHENRWRLVLDGLGISLTITLLAFALATLGGFGVCGLRMSKKRILRAAGRVYITILRGTPIVVLLMIAYYVIFAGSEISAVIVAVIAFGANGAAFIGEIVRAAILTVDKGQIEAARSMGFSKAGAFFTVTFPQAARVAFPTYMSEFVSLFKMTSVVGYIAITDLTRAGDIIRSRTFDALFPLLMVAALYLVMATAMISLFSLLNRAANKRSRRGRV